MTPQEIIEAYDVLANETKDYVSQQAQTIGNSQRSLGPLAEAVANPSGQTSGLANYTYNRTLRPTVDTLSASLVTQGRSQAMDRYLKDELMKAKNAYEDAKNNYTVAATTPKTNVTNYNQETKKTTKVSSTTPDGMTSKTFTYNDGKNNYTGIVYFNSDGSIAGAETPYMSYTGPGAVDFYNSNSQYISGWGSGGSVYDDGSKTKTATTPSNIPPGDGSYPNVVDMDGMRVFLVTPASGDQYYITQDGSLKFSVNDVMKWF